MFYPTKDLIQSLIEDSKSKHVDWKTSDDLYCAECFYNNEHYIICRYLNENSELEISFNLINNFGHIVNPYREFNFNDDLYQLLNELYLLAKPNAVDNSMTA